MTNCPDAEALFNYSIVEQGEVKVLGSCGEDFAKDPFLRSAATCVRYYESIRGLPGFDPSHCPIIECQWVDGIHYYFLQYHRTRGIEPAQFEILRQPEEGEMEAPFVRGATPPEGMVVNTAFSYPGGGRTLMEHEEGSFDWHSDKVFSELMMRRRDVYSCWAHAHLPRSFLFKPRLAVVADFRAIREVALARGALDATMSTGTPFRIPLRVISDGRRAFVKVIK